MKKRFFAFLGSLAVLAIVAGCATGATPTPTPSPTRTPVPATATPTSPPLLPTATTTPTTSPTPTATAVPSPTAIVYRPTPTPRPPLATPTPRPPAATATPTRIPATPTSAFPYTPHGSLSAESNCGTTQIKLFVMDSLGNPLDGVRFRIRPPGGAWTADSHPTGAEGKYAGWTDFSLAGEAVPATWQVWAIDGAGNPLSASVAVTTDGPDRCAPGSGGRQIVTVRWRANFAGPNTSGWSIEQPGNYQYDLSGNVTWEPNCGVTQIKIYVKDVNGSPVDGVRFHLRGKSGSFQIDSVATGSEWFESGWTDVFLGNEAVAWTWRIWVIDGAGSRISPVLAINTEGPENCAPEGDGHQVATTYWTKKW